MFYTIVFLNGKGKHNLSQKSRISYNEIRDQLKNITAIANDIQRHSLTAIHVTFINVIIWGFQKLSMTPGLLSQTNQPNHTTPHFIESDILRLNWRPWEENLWEEQQARCPARCSWRGSWGRARGRRAPAHQVPLHCVACQIFREANVESCTKMDKKLPHLTHQSKGLFFHQCIWLKQISRRNLTPK